MSAASPEDAAEVEVGSVLSSNFVTSALPVPRGPSLLPKEESSSDTLEKSKLGWKRPSMRWNNKQER